MARRKVVTETFMAVKKPVTFSKTGKQVRKIHTEATSPRLLKYRACIAEALKGQKYADYKAVREAFRTAAHKCKGVA